MSDAKHYPTDPRGELDAGNVPRPPTPCARRFDVAPGVVTWCHLPDRHEGDCSVSFPRALPPNDFMPKRKP